MDDIHAKPRLVFFQYQYDANLPRFLVIHALDHVRCLSEFFEVTVINHDCDYGQVCDQFQPELTLFESGLDNFTCRKPRITNTGANPKIPKLALHNADAFSGSRAGFISDLDGWGIETVFAIATTAAEHMPELADRIFVWPNFIDPEVYRDYGEWKSIPVLLTGNKSAFYPWRKRIFKLVSERFPSLLCVHPGYDPGATGVQFMFGESYARTINASSIVPACGTVAKEVVRKHFEVPACKACLVTEESPALQAAGFVSMQNCVFADEHDVLDKLGWLFRHPDELARITGAGYQLAHSRHTFKQRDQILQWYRLRQQLGSGQRIVQTNPFEPLRVVSESDGCMHSPVICNGVHLALIRQGNEHLRAGQTERAAESYGKCLNYLKWMPEAKLGLALCHLHHGNAKAALSAIEELLAHSLGQYKARDPDPEEWAWYVISLLCLGKCEEASEQVGRYGWLHHPELRRARWAAALLKNNKVAVPWPGPGQGRQRATIHQLPSLSFEDWVRRLCRMLDAAGQRDLRTSLERELSRGAPLLQQLQETGDSPEEGMPHPGRPAEDELQSRGVPAHINSSADFERRFSVRKTRTACKTFIAGILHRLETRHGYFLPYHLSAMRKDEFFHEIRQLAREEDIRTAVVIGAVGGEGSTEAFLAGLLENDRRPKAFCMNGPTRRFARLEKAFAGHPSVKCCRMSPSSREDFALAVESVIKQLKEDNRTSTLDAILINTAALKPPGGIGVGLQKELHSARFVLLNGINKVPNYEVHQGLLADPNYVLTACNPGLRDGYAIFKREHVAAEQDIALTVGCFSEGRLPGHTGSHP